MRRVCQGMFVRNITELIKWSTNEFTDTKEKEEVYKHQIAKLNLSLISLRTTLHDHNT